MVFTYYLSARNRFVTFQHFVAVINDLIFQNNYMTYYQSNLFGFNNTQNTHCTHTHSTRRCTLTLCEFQGHAINNQFQRKNVNLHKNNLTFLPHLAATNKICALKQASPSRRKI